VASSLACMGRGVRPCSGWSSCHRHRRRAPASATAALPPSCRCRCLHFYSHHCCHRRHRTSAAADALPRCCRVGRSFWRLFGWLVGRLVGRSVGRVGWLIGRLVGRSVGQSVGRSVSWSVGWLVGRSVSRLVHWSVCWSVDWSVSHLVIGCLVGWWVGWSIGPLVGRSTDLPEVAGGGQQGSRDQMQHLVFEKPPNGVKANYAVMKYGRKADCLRLPDKVGEEDRTKQCGGGSGGGMNPRGILTGLRRQRGEVVQQMV
jgi:hypothetical protein